MNISIMELKRYVENGYEIGFSYNGKQYAITHDCSVDESLNLKIIDNARWKNIQRFSSFEDLSNCAKIQNDSFESVWAQAIEIRIEKLDLAILIQTVRFGELEFRVHHKRFFVEGAPGGYYCISFDEKDKDGEPVCYDFEADSMAKSFDMFMNARIFDGLTFSEVYDVMTIIRGVFFEA